MAEDKDYIEVINQLYQAELSGGALKGACSTGPASGIKVVNFVRNSSH
jgi:hypothetical protein